MMMMMMMMIMIMIMLLLLIFSIYDDLITMTTLMKCATWTFSLICLWLLCLFLNFCVVCYCFVAWSLSFFLFFFLLLWWWWWSDTPPIKGHHPFKPWRGMRPPFGSWRPSMTRSARNWWRTITWCRSQVELVRFERPCFFYGWRAKGTGSASRIQIRQATMLLAPMYILESSWKSEIVALCNCAGRCWLSQKLGNSPWRAIVLACEPHICKSRSFASFIAGVSN